MKILIADDDLTSRRILAALLERQGHKVVAANDGQEAWERLHEDDPPRLAVLDWEMPRMSGPEIVARLREETASYTYVILLTAKAGKGEIVEGIAKGADDYIVKPFDPAELSVRIRTGERILNLERRLVEANRKLEVLAQTDPLTGLYNRRALLRALEQNTWTIAPVEVPAAFVMADIDHFKCVNDSEGHDAGDAVIKEFARRLKALFRQSDVVSRVGGEEFLVVVPDVTAETALKLAERARATIEKTPFALTGGKSISLTCSLGVHAATIRGEWRLKENMKLADIALYAAKAKGRNCVILYTPPEAG